MKAYVIKNKEGTYRAGVVKNFSGFYHYVDKLVIAEFFNDYKLAKAYCLENDEPVEVTIAETEDLEKSIRKQICNKINNYIDKLIYERFADGETKCLTIDVDEFTEFLYDIEQGEEL